MHSMFHTHHPTCQWRKQSYPSIHNAKSKESPYGKCRQQQTHGFIIHAAALLSGRCAYRRQHPQIPAPLRKGKLKQIVHENDRNQTDQQKKKDLPGHCQKIDRIIRGRCIKCQYRIVHFYLFSWHNLCQFSVQILLYLTGIHADGTVHIAINRFFPHPPDGGIGSTASIFIRRCFYESGDGIGMINPGFFMNFTMPLIKRITLREKSKVCRCFLPLSAA